MRVGIIGGALQGVETAYLARKAGWEVVVADRRSKVPAAGLCDRFVRIDAAAENDLNDALRKIDLIIPAMENDAALSCLSRWTRDKGIPFAFDPAAYAVSSSKTESSRLFSRCGVSTPRPWPGCGLPVVVKPDRGSGSRGVKVFYDSQSVRTFINGAERKSVVQQFVSGPSYSMEVIGGPGGYAPLQVTDLFMDEGFDCKRVTAPTVLSQPLVSEFEGISVLLADTLNLKGLMDVEVILHDDELYVLEIDARFPSQTPTVVYWNSGVNMVEVMGDLFVENKLKYEQKYHISKGVVYEHIKASAGRLETAGEHIISSAGPLSLRNDFFGADEALTDYLPGCDAWAATLIVSGNSRKDAWEKRNFVIDDITKHLSLQAYPGPNPKRATKRAVEESGFDQTNNR